jgi:hypothetical protein
MPLPQRVAATPSSREKTAVPFGPRCGPGDEASQLHAAPFQRLVGAGKTVETVLKYFTGFHQAEIRCC